MEAAAATGRSGRSRTARTAAPPPDLTMGAGLAGACAARAAGRRSRGDRGSRPRAALTCAARAIALCHLRFRSASAALAERATQLRARGKLVPSLACASAAARRLSEGMSTVGLTARRLGLCSAAVKPAFALSRCCRVSRNLVRADHGGFAARKQSPAPAFLSLLLRRRRSAGW